MDGDEIITAAQFDSMSPEERYRVAAEGLTTDLTKIPPDFLERARQKGRELLDVEPPSGG